MFQSFLFSILTTIFLLYVPCFFLLRALGLSRIYSITASPLFACLLYAILPIFYYRFGIQSNLATILIPSILICLIAYFGKLIYLHITQKHFKLPDETITILPKENKTDWLFILIYIIAGSIICYFIFIKNIGTYDAFYARYDTLTHINLVQSFLDSGKWSSLHADRYFDLPYDSRPITKLEGFYPAAWHAIAALVQSITNAKIAVVTNAMTVTTISVVFPSGMCLLMRTLFKDNLYVIAAGAVATISFGIFPWAFGIWTPTYPNLLGFSTMLPLIALFMRIFQAKKPSVPYVIKATFLILAGIMSIALTHTNTVFNVYVFLAAFGGHFFFKRIREAEDSSTKRMRIIHLCIYWLCVIGIWIIILSLPLSVFNFSKESIMKVDKAITRVFTLRFFAYAGQIVLSIICLIGFVFCVIKKRFWLILPVAFFALGYIVAAAGIEPFERYLSGFWYESFARMCQSLAIMLMPIAAYSLGSLWEMLANFIYKKKNEKVGISENESMKNELEPNAKDNHVNKDANKFLDRNKIFATTVASSVIVLFMIINFGPPIETIWDKSQLNHSSFAMAGKNININYNPQKDQIYSAKEVKFVNEIMKEIPDDALVINQPHDGSSLAYGINHLKTYYRELHAKRLTDEAILIRKSLKNYSTNKEVREAVEKIDADYVLLLDAGIAFEDGIWFKQYANPDYWRGLNDINDDTPGFTLVKAKGDMRLYKIDREKYYPNN